MRTRRQTQRLPLLALVAAAIPFLVGFLDGGPASAAYPGGNGKIAYESAVTGNFEIFVMNADGSGQTNVSRAGGDNRDPAWSPNGAKIAFSRAGDLWVMNADGSGQVNLTPGPNDGQGNTGIQPTWSPDGTRIAYADNANIWIMDASSGGGKVNVTPTPGEAEAQPAWSPDGARIAFVKQSDIWVMNADGSGQRPLATTPRGEFRPDWSPDARRIAYDRDGDIWVMNADGTGQTLLTDGVGETGSEPAWSPDGTRIVFSSNGLNAPNGHDIFVMNPDGTSIRRLNTPVPAGDLDPNWQPTAAVVPPPVVGVSVNITPVSGVVRVRLRGTNRFVNLARLRNVPVGSELDVTRGRVRLTSAAGNRRTQTSVFYAGRATVRQPRVRTPFTNLQLSGPLSCPRRSPAATKPPRVRRLWGNGKGRFRTLGRYAGATVRGTIWLTEDRCDGTLIRVQQGRVDVRDNVRNRTIRLRAGQSYLARARR
jgi:Tol biopolymer transport system component